MYLYRALNNAEMNDICKGIKASDTSIKSSFDILNEIPSHVAKASDVNQKDCWISTGKDLKVIIEEYALPQNGSYNTCKDRKPIAVINMNPWKAAYTSSDCYTIFKFKDHTPIDFSHYSHLYTPSKTWALLGNYLTTITDEPLTTKRSKNLALIKNIKDTIVKNDITEALFDCSMESNPSDVPINKMCLMNFSTGKRSTIKPKYGLFEKGVTAVNNGIAKTSKEVLCYKEIPADRILKVLKPIEQDLLYMLNDSDRADLLNRLIYNEVKIDFVDGIIHVISSRKAKDFEEGNSKYPSLVGSSLLSPSNSDANRNLYDEYMELIDNRKTLLCSILTYLGYLGYDIEHCLIPEEKALWVYDFDFNRSKKITVNKRLMYDLYLFRYKGVVHNANDIGDVSFQNMPDLYTEIINDGLLDIEK